MRQLLLLRHAKSSWDDPRLSDHARPLNPRGRRAASGVATTLRELGAAPELVLVSSARRTLQTLDALGPFPPGTAIEPMDALYLASWNRLLELLQAVPDGVRSVLVIGHNPGLHELAMALVGPAGMLGAAAERLADGLPTATLVHLAIADAWARLDTGGARLLDFRAPADGEAEAIA